jgi:8-amino-3,8-dideoxy-alpha-D-manno-octulosonate transaminase
MKLAIEGGKPARKHPLPPNYPGAMMIGPEEVGEVSHVINQKSLFRYYGPQLQNAVRTFEESMARDLEVPFALGVSSGTAALITALKAMGIGYGDKVIVPANTFLASAGAVVCCNAVPVFVDIDDSLNLNPDELEKVFDDEVKAIIAVHILGNPCAMDAIMDFANKKNIHVIEDVAQACGARYKDQYAGTIGHIGAFSFQKNKVLTAGEGGAIITSDQKLFERSVRYHDQGLFRERDRYHFDGQTDNYEFIGQNYRMSEITGAVLKEQWQKLNPLVKSMKVKHRNIQEALSSELRTMKFRKIADKDGDIGSNLGMILPNPEIAMNFVKALHAENIGVSVLYGGKPVYMMPALFNQRTADKDNFPFNYPFKQSVVYKKGLCPNAEDLISRTVFLPVSPVLTGDDVNEIIEGVIKVYKKIVLPMVTNH